jgi:hypothetical protein
MHRNVLGLYGMATLTLAACTPVAVEDMAAQAAPRDVATPDKPLAALDRDLTVGDEGEDVAMVHAYLARYGYLPNDALAARYPSFRPLVARSPADDETFDTTTELAVRTLQRDLGLESTGVVNAATRELLRKRRCSHPEGIAQASGSGQFVTKFATHHTVRIDDGAWRFFNDARTVTPAMASRAARDALATWSDATGQSFHEIEGGPFSSFLGILFTDLDGEGGEAGNSNLSWMGGRINLDEDEAWTLTYPAPEDKTDLQAILLHEFGHALGLAHSSKASAVMFALVGSRRELGEDDRVAMSTLYPRWGIVGGGARDIAVGGEGTAWVVGTHQVPGGYSIRMRQDDAWSTVRGGAVRIAAGPTGNAFIVDDEGAIRERLAWNGQWMKYPGCARDIAVGDNGALWVIGCTRIGGGYSIHKWNGASWDRAPGAGVRIAVDSKGKPWIVNIDDKIYRFSSANPASGEWQQMPGNGTDIAVDPHDYAYVVGTDQEVYVWNEQREDRGWNIPGRAAWVRVGLGGARSVAAGPDAAWAAIDLEQLNLIARQVR